MGAREQGLGRRALGAPRQGLVHGERTVVCPGDGTGLGLGGGGPSGPPTAGG